MKQSRHSIYFKIRQWVGMPLIGIGALILLQGCGSTKVTESVSEPATHHSSLGNAEFYTSALADELFAGLRPNTKARFAIATFVPVTTLKFDADNQNPLMLLGHQLEQGMLTEASKRGFIAQDYKATNDIIIEKEADRVFSRDVSDLYLHHHSVDFYISGTIVEQQYGAIVNARIINVKSKDVVAAATQFFPSDLFWQAESVTSRGGLIYRSSSE